MSQRYTATIRRTAATVSLASNAAHTFCGWVRVLTTGIGDVIYGDIANNTAYGDSTWLGFEDNEFVFREAVTGGSIYEYRYPLVTNTWFHLALTYDGSAVRSYVNGTLVNTGAWSANSRAAFNFLDIGSYETADFVAQALMCFPSALSASQVREAMHLAPPAGVTTYAWWPLEASAPTLDATGNGHTLSGAGTATGDQTLVVSTPAYGITRSYGVARGDVGVNQIFGTGGVGASGSGTITKTVALTGTGAVSVSGSATVSGGTPTRRRRRIRNRRMLVVRGRR